MSKSIYNVLRYFAYFRYPPTFEELHTFYPNKISRQKLTERLQYLTKKRRIKLYSHSDLTRYTLREYSSIWKEYLRKEKYATSKIKLGKRYIKILRLFPQIKLVGFSGSIAMSSASRDDDVDLFLITKRNRLFTGRLIGILLAFIMGLKRKPGFTKAKNKVCLNLLFDESNLVIPKDKRTPYVAHEVLQMKPLVNKQHIYGRFLYANRWVFAVFPNSKKYFPVQSKSAKLLSGSLVSELVGDSIEHLLRKLQLSLIRRHITTELVTKTQLWFFPEDFQKRINTLLKTKGKIPE